MQCSKLRYEMMMKDWIQTSWIHVHAIFWLENNAIYQQSHYIYLIGDTWAFPVIMSSFWFTWPPKEQYGATIGIAQSTSSCPVAVWTCAKAGTNSNVTAKRIAFKAKKWKLPRWSIAWLFLVCGCRQIGNPEKLHSSGCGWPVSKSNCGGGHLCYAPVSSIRPRCGE